MAASAASPLILRGRAHGPADPPWRSVLRALGPLIVPRPEEELAALLRRDARPILVDLPGMAKLAATVPAPTTSALADPGSASRVRWRAPALARPGRGGQPIVLVLEDLHAADAATRAFAAFVARTAKRERIALVLSYQPDRLLRDHPLRENLAVIDAGLRQPVQIDLGPLAGSVAAIIEGIEGERPRRQWWC
ncbi:MAG: hypothetical protein U0838_13285 [Chloroflexota bacterium]